MAREVAGRASDLRKVDVAKAVRRVGSKGAVFQFRQLREDLNVDAKKRNDANRLWNSFAELMEEGCAEQVPGGSRKRHTYYRIKNDDKLLQLLSTEPVAVDGTPRPAGTGPERLARIEADIRTILEKLEKLDTLDSKVSQLVQAWS
jgi:hypothetical protein